MKKRQGRFFNNGFENEMKCCRALAAECLKHLSSMRGITTQQINSAA